MGFLDFEGNVRLAFDGVFIERQVASVIAAVPDEKLQELLKIDGKRDGDAFGDRLRRRERLPSSRQPTAW